MVAAAKKEKEKTTRTMTGTCSVKKPHFFKILLRDFARRLSLPPIFAGQHLRGSSDKAVVRDAGGGAWDAALEKTADGAFLTGGWAKFVEDHALREHDLVVFRYDGDMHFTVTLSFDRTACEKDAVSGGERCHVSSPRLQGVEEEDVKVSSDVRCPPEKSLQQVAVPHRRVPKGDKHSGVYIPRKYGINKETTKDGSRFPFCSTFPYFVSVMTSAEIIKPRVLKLPVAFPRELTPSTRTCMSLRDSNGNVWTVNYITSKTGRCFSGGWTAFMRDNNLQEGDYCAFELVAPAEFNITVIRENEVKHTGVKRSGGYIPRKPGIIKETTKDGACFPFCSTFPYFVSAMTSYELVKPRLLRLPVEFLQALTPSIRTCASFRNSNGNLWTVNCITSKSGRYFSGGWASFMRDNNLREGDYCAFELVAPAEFNVTVIRADEVLKHTSLTIYNP